jgi:membrane protein YdbS with pleckstrin-like domain
MAYGSANTHLLHEGLVLVIERIVVVQIIVALVSFLIYALLLGVANSPGLLFVSFISALLQTIDAVLITTIILSWERRSFFITPEEVVVRSGVVNLNEKIYRYEDIDSIELSQDALGKVLNYGSIYFYSQSEKEEVGITNIATPMTYLEIVQDFKAANVAKNQGKQPPADEQKI